MTDKERLDWLQEHMHGYGKGWILRPSTCGRGLRLHESSGRGYSLDPKKDIRKAIDEGIEHIKELEGQHETKRRFR